MNNKLPIFIFVSAAILILWQMLLPGYILTLDMTFAPKIKMDFADSGFYNFAPVYYLLRFFNFFMTGWVIQKIILFVLFFSLGYSAYRFLPLENEVARIWAGVFYMANPFVYERLLAGHWHLLFAYAFLPPFIFYSTAFTGKADLKNSLRLFFWLFAIGLMSPHLLFMTALILVSSLAFYFVRRQRSEKAEFLKNTFFGICMFLFLSSYWLLPYVVQPESRIYPGFTQADFEAFRTANDARLGAELNVLALYGFWGEHENWSGYWLWPQDNFVLFAIMFSVLVGLLMGGIILAWRQRRAERYLFFAIGLAAYVFSLGLADSFFLNLNQWLFDNVPLWSGLRDTQKWSAWLVLAVVYFASISVTAVIHRISDMPKALKMNLTYGLFLIPLLYMYPIWGGFARQLQPVQYPSSWYEANRVLNQDKDNFKVLFLPWHEYMSFSFNNKIISSNLAKKFFDKPVIQGENMELGMIYSRGMKKEQAEVDAILRYNQNEDASSSLRELRKLGIKYILYSKFEASEKDSQTMEYLSSNKSFLRMTIDLPDLTIFEIVLR